MLLIDATYVNSGGGKNLLNIFLKKLYLSKEDFEILIDQRLVKDTSYGHLYFPSKVHVIKNNEISRFLFYIKNYKKFKVIFCFASIPPPLLLSSRKVIIYFHNLFLLSNNSDKLNFKLKIKNFYFKFFSNEKYQYYVQSNFVKYQLNSKTQINEANIFVLPFYDDSRFYNKIQTNNSRIKYTYIADSSPHKNHLFLLEAWFKFFDSISGEKNVELHLTLDYNNKSLNEIIQNSTLLEKYNIINHNIINHFKVLNLLKESNYLLYVSNFESFGLPLIEAYYQGCDIIASDLQYVKEIIKPTLEFKSNDCNSLCNTLLISYKNNNLPNPTLLINNKIEFIINQLKYV